MSSEPIPVEEEDEQEGAPKRSSSVRLPPVAPVTGQMAADGTDIPSFPVGQPALPLAEGRLGPLWFWQGIFAFAFEGYDANSAKALMVVSLKDFNVAVGLVRRLVQEGVLRESWAQGTPTVPQIFPRELNSCIAMGGVLDSCPDMLIPRLEQRWPAVGELVEVIGDSRTFRVTATRPLVLTVSPVGVDGEVLEAPLFAWSKKAIRADPSPVMSPALSQTRDPVLPLVEEDISAPLPTSRTFLPGMRGSLSIVSWNMNGLQSRLAALEIILKDRPDVVFLQEVRSCKAEALAMISQTGFDTYVVLRASAQGGGVAVLVRRSFAASEQVVLTGLTKGVEIAACRVHPADHSPSFVVASIYISPTEHADDHEGILKSLRDVLGAHNPTVVAGDLNGHSPLWDQTVLEPDSYGKSIMEFLTQSSLTLLTRAGGPPTHLPQQTHIQGRVLDLVMADHAILPASEDGPLALEACGSDHRVIWCTFGRNAQKRTHWMAPRIAWSRVSDSHWAEFEDRLSRCLRAPRGSVDRRYTALVCVIQKAAENFPRTFFRRPRHTVSERVAEAMTEAARAWDTGDAHAIRQAEAAVELAMEDDRWLRHAHSSPWQLWRRTESRARNRPLDGDPSTLSQLRRFSEIFTAKHSYRMAQFDFVPDAVNGLSQEDHPISFNMVDLKAAIAAQANQGAADPEGIPPMVLRHLPGNILLAILDLANLTIRQKRLPRKWKDYVMFPNPKRLDPSTFDQFRPVTLSRLLARIVERMVHSKIDERLTINLRQHGFTRGSSSEVMLARFVHFLEESSRRSKRECLAGAVRDSRSKVSFVTLAVAIDFSDAFCSVDPELYLQALRRREIPEELVTWLRDQLSDRSFRVTWQGLLSESNALKHGFGQGTVGGPKGWNVVADACSIELEGAILRALRGLPVSDGYAADFGWLADDLTLFVSGPDLSKVHGILQTMTSKVASWARSTGLQISSKTKAAYFARSVPDHIAQQSLKVTEGIVVKYGTSLSLLGITVDSQLTFELHALELLKDTSILLERFKMVAPFLAPEQLREIIVGAFLSRWLYAASVWWPHVKVETKERFESRLRMLCRMAYGLIQTAPNAAVLAEARLLPVHAMVAKRAFGLVSNIKRNPWLEARLVVAPVPAKVNRNVPRVDRAATPQLIAEPGPSFAQDYLLKAAAPIPRCPLLPKALPYDSASYGNAVDVRFHLRPDVGITSTSPADQRLAYNESCLRKFPHRFLVLSDGSVEGARSGGGALIWQQGSMDCSEMARTCSAGTMAASYTAELLAIKLALESLQQLQARLPPQGRDDVLVGSDGLSALETLQLGPLCQKTTVGQEIWSLLLQLTARFNIEICFMFAHCGWTPGDHVDRLAKSALDRPDHKQVPVLAQDEARHLWNPVRSKAESDMLKEMGFRSTLLKAVEEKDKPQSLSLPKLTGVSRSAARTIAQLRTGCCGRLGGWRHEAPDDCSACKAKAVLCRNGGAVKHLFSCPALAHVRILYGVEDHMVLAKAVKKAALYAMAAIKLVGAGACGGGP
ncbi:MAG: endonuclease/exonuclease/phosphatase family protein [Verrucomicrobiota bacterium]